MYCTSDININHQRNDFRLLILYHPLLFDVVRYERCTEGCFLVARGEKDAVVWDDWDDLLATASEAEGERGRMKVFCESYFNEL